MKVERIILTRKRTWLSVIRMQIQHWKYTVHNLKSSQILGHMRIRQKKKMKYSVQTNLTSLMAHVWSSSSLFFFPRGKLQLDPFHPFTSKHYQLDKPKIKCRLACLKRSITFTFDKTNMIFTTTSNI